MKPLFCRDCKFLYEHVCTHPSVDNGQDYDLVTGLPLVNLVTGGGLTSKWPIAEFVREYHCGEKARLFSPKEQS